MTANKTMVAPKKIGIIRPLRPFLAGIAREAGGIEGAGAYLEAADKGAVAGPVCANSGGELCLGASDIGSTPTSFRSLLPQLRQQATPFTNLARQLLHSTICRVTPEEVE